MQSLEASANLKQALEQASITGLFYYPIKSCGGWRIEQAEVIEQGLKHDRELMVIEAATGKVVTQREIAKMALIIPQIRDNSLKVTAPQMSALEVPLLKEGSRLKGDIWDEAVETVDQGDEVAGWFSEFLKVECRVVRMAPDFIRQVDPDHSIQDQDQVAFADGYPLLIISEESLADLNGRMDEPLPMNRFRPNIVIAGSGVAFGEDKMKRIALGEVILDLVKPCARCAITTTDQETTIRGKEPLRTLATYRRNAKGGVLFGQNVIHENQGVLRVGDKVKVLELQG